MMPILLYVFLPLISLVILLLLLYVLLLIRPCKAKSTPSALLCDYAHRGLHGDSIPENSLAAFERAVKNGVGIELDVQLSRDGVVMVFHDATLSRMTGRHEKLCELDASELCTLSLGNTDQRIPLFSEVLSRVNGQVPLLIELKGESFDTSLCAKVAALLRTYHGPYCIESFNPLLLKAMRQELPDAYYGLLYTNVCRDKKKVSILNLLLTVMAFNFLARPNFIAYNKIDQKSLPVLLTTSCYRAPEFVWTVTNESELQKAKERKASAIFENI